MREKPTQPNGEHPKVPSPEAGQERWERATLVSNTARTAHYLQEVLHELKDIRSNLDHLHADMTALREVARVPRPECYPDLPRKRAARRARPTPPAPDGEERP